MKNRALILILAMVFCALAAGCVSHTKMTEVYATDEKGNVIIRDGRPVVLKTIEESTDVEMEAVKAQGMVARQLAEKAEKLKTELRTPILMMRPDGTVRAVTDTKGNPVYVQASAMDSGVAASITKAADTSNHASQGVKLAKEGFGFAGKVVNPVLTWGIVDSVVTKGTGSDNSTTYNDSFNNPNQSPQTVDNVAANVAPNATDSHSVSTSTETNETTTEVVDDDG